MKGKFRIPRDSTTGGTFSTRFRMGTHTHTSSYVYIYVCREEEDTFRRNGVKGQGTHRVGSINSSRSGSRRRPTFLSGHRSSRVPRILLTFCLFSSPPFPVFVIDDLGVDLRRDEWHSDEERERERRLSMLMTCFNAFVEISSSSSLGPNILVLSFH